jgi:hypothetical protein
VPITTTDYFKIDPQTSDLLKISSKEINVTTSSNFGTCVDLSQVAD